MLSYKVLNRQIFKTDKYSIVPIRREDRYLIMKWRNEQIYHLRQNKLLTEEDQDKYFDNVVSKIYEQDQPDQLLFSYLEGEKCLGYGGLVHLNWKDKNAEISFIMDTCLEKEHFEFHWSMYLSLIEQVAFEELSLHKIFTFAFDLRPHLYAVFERNGFIKEAELKEHVFFENQFISVIIHYKLNKRKDE